MNSGWAAIEPAGLTPAQRRIAAGGGRWLVFGPPRSGKRATLRAWLARAHADGYAPERMLVLAPERAAAGRLAAESALPDVDVQGLPGFAQQLIIRHWPLVAEQLGTTADAPEFLLFDLTQYLTLGLYRRSPGALRRLTIREDRLVAQLIDTLDLAAAHGLDNDEAWRRTAVGLHLPTDDPAMRAAGELAQRFRAYCSERGLLPFFLQLESFNWLLGHLEVQAELLAGYDLIAVDGLDELAPVAAARLLELAGRSERALLTCSPDGGLRWLLGASVERTLALGRGAVERGDLRALLLRQSKPPALAERIAVAGSLVDAAFTDRAQFPRVTPGWTLHLAERPDELAEQVTRLVAEHVRHGVEPQQIALFAPTLDPLLTSELTRRLAAQDIRLHVERRAEALTDERHARACLTALRCLPGADRPPSAVELADLVVTLTGSNPIAAQRWARVLYDRRQGLREPERVTTALPYELDAFLAWRVASPETPAPAEALPALAKHVLSLVERERAELEAAAARLTRLAQRYTALLPELGGAQALPAFLRLTASPLVASRDASRLPVGGVVLATPYTFLAGGRVVELQCWLDVAGPGWGRPAAQLLCNPQALAAQQATELGDLAAEERFRVAQLRRLLCNLAARCDGELHAFAARNAPDGSQLDGPLLEGFLLTGVTVR